MATDPPTPFVRVADVGHHYGQGDSLVRVLDGVSFEVARGSLCVIVGASGSGKSTLLNALGGLDTPQEGTVTVDGLEITSLSPRALTRYRRRHVGFIFQFYNLVPDLTVRENVQVTAQLAREPLDAEQLLADLGMAEHAGKFPSQLSGGQQQRCAIARALVKGSDLLLCDEPTGALDHHTSLQMLQVLEEVNSRYGTTLVVVTHNDAITAMADQVIELRDGRIARDEHNPHPVPAAEIIW